MTSPSDGRFGLFNTQARTIHSAFVDDDYQVGVWLPLSYTNSERVYPALYILDGDYAFGVATGLVPTLIGTRDVPEMIIVGIGYHSVQTYSEFGARRERDLLPPGFEDSPSDARAPAFLDFLAREVLPMVEANYRASAEDRALYGFSAGGFFALWVMLTQPETFRRYVAASCTWPHAAAFLLRCARESKEGPHATRDAYLAVGGLEEDQLPGLRALARAIKGRREARFRLHTEVLPGEKHSAGVIAGSLLSGLKTVFAT